MSDEQHRHGYAPEPSGSSEPTGSAPEQASAGEQEISPYAAGDTGTRAVPVVPRDQPAEDDLAHDDSAYEPGYDEPAHAEPDGAAYDAPVYDEAPDTIVPMRAGHRAAPRRSRRSRVPGCLAVLVALAVVVAIVVVGGAKGYHALKDHLGGGAADYAGPGTGSVTFQVHQGDSATQIGRNLKSAGVVESVDAFISAAAGDPAANRIQVGFYQLKHQMKASDALGVLTNPKALIQSVVVVPEGARVDQVVASIAAKTKIKRADVIAALKKPSTLGLPAAAKGNPEGYLFPATYTITPGETATQLLKQMVAKSVQVDQELDLGSAAAKVGLTPEQVVTVASILEYEAKRTQDYPKVARAIYNRLKAGMPLQSDATVSYATKVSGQVWTTAQMRASSSPYNTYQHTGLPPGPIGNPGETTLKAALNPASGSWLYWVVVNLKTGETVFSNTLAEHNAAVQKFREYCRTSSAC